MPIREIAVKVTLEEIMNIPANNVPFNIKLRLLLNSKGIEFEDDGKFSLIYNKNPVPKGKITAIRDESYNGYYYKQIIQED